MHWASTMAGFMHTAPPKTNRQTEIDVYKRQHHHRSLADVTAIIDGSQLCDEIGRASCRERV